MRVDLGAVIYAERDKHRVCVLAAPDRTVPSRSTTCSRGRGWPQLLAGRGTDYRHADEADFDRELDMERRITEATTAGPA